MKKKPDRVIKETVKRNDPHLKQCPKCGATMVRTPSNFQTCPKGCVGLRGYTSPWARG